MAKKKEPTKKPNRRVPSNTAPAGRPHLVIRLKKGWMWDASRRHFKNVDGQTLQTIADLPRYTRILQQVPSMAKRKPKTKAEDELARGIQIVPPKSILAKLTSSREIKFFNELVEVVSAWPCVEKAWVSPKLAPAESKRQRTKTTSKSTPTGPAKRKRTRRPKSAKRRQVATSKGGMSLPGGVDRKR